MQIFDFDTVGDGVIALEEAFDEKIAENLEGQDVITAEEVKASWLAYNNFSDYLMDSYGSYDVDVSAFNNSIWGHFLSQYSSINV